METVGAAWRRLQAALEDGGIDPAPREGQRMVQYVLDLDNTSLLAQEWREITANDSVVLEIILKRRLQREPLAYILELADFYGREWRVAPGVLIPRPDTEVLVETVIGYRPSVIGEPVVAVEVGLGSGAVLGSVLLAKSEWRGVGIEISPDALAIAEENLRRAGVLERCELFEGDLLTPLAPNFTKRVDVIFSNPPYIAEEEWAALEPDVRNHEPKLALAAGEDGLDVYRRLIPQALERLKPGGMLAVEMGFTQGEAVCGLFTAAGFKDIKIMPDLAGRNRVVVGAK
jgi:release factor glutamine methyltransferase